MSGPAVQFLELALVPRPRKRAVLYDIDGTLASAEHRAHLVEKPSGLRDWSTFHSGMAVDAPIAETIAQARRDKAAGFAVVLLSLRPERFRGATEDWLRRYGVPFDELHLRPEASYGVVGPEMKRRIFEDVISPRYRVEMAYDDYDPILEMWEDAGVPTTRVVDPLHPPTVGSLAKDPGYPKHRPSEAYIKPHKSVTGGGKLYDVRGHWRKLRRRKLLPTSIFGDLVDRP